MMPVKSSFPTLSTLPRLFDDFLSRDLGNWNLDNFSSQGSTLPAVNVRETADAYVVEMAAPGLRREDFHIEVDGDLLTISGEHQSEHGDGDPTEDPTESSSDAGRTGASGERYTRREFHYQSFQRSFRLSKRVVDDNRIQAKYENGLLRIVVPKREEAKATPKRTIEVS